MHGVRRCTPLGPHAPQLLLSVRLYVFGQNVTEDKSCAIALDKIRSYLSYLMLCIEVFPPIVFGSPIEIQYCISMPIQIQRRSLATRSPSKSSQARVWHSISRFHHTPAHPIYWEEHFASRVRGHRCCR